MTPCNTTPCHSHKPFKDKTSLMAVIQLWPQISGIGIMSICYQSEMESRGFPRPQAEERSWLGPVAAPLAPASNPVALPIVIWDWRPLSTHLPVVPSSATQSYTEQANAPSSENGMCKGPRAQSSLVDSWI